MNLDYIPYAKSHLLPHEFPLKLRFITRQATVQELLWYPELNRLAYPKTGQLYVFEKDVYQEIAAWYGFNLHKQNSHMKMIQMGRGCNFNCSYCCQGDSHAMEPPLESGAIRRYLRWFKKLVQAYPQVNDIALWGGEPLLYFDYIQELTHGIQSFHPRANIFVLTNGSLLTPKIARWFMAHKVKVGISHDGPRNWDRSGDILSEGTVTKAAIDLMFRYYPGSAYFSPVVDFSVAGLKETMRFFNQRVGKNAVYGDMLPAFPFTETQYDGFIHSAEHGMAHYQSMVLDLLEVGPSYEQYNSYARQQLWHIITKKATMHNAYCVAAQQLPFVSSLDGTVLRCHNIAQDHPVSETLSNVRGHLSDFHHIEPHKLRSWVDLDQCKYCPVLLLCRGSCPITHGEVFQKQCRVRFWHNLGLLAYSFFMGTGMMLAEIEGDFHHAENGGLTMFDI